jgi:hypothetical protein
MSQTEIADRLAYLEEEIAKKEAELKRLKTTDLTEENPKTPIQVDTPVRVTEAEPMKKQKEESRGRGGRGLGKASRKLVFTNEEKIARYYDEQDFIKRFDDEECMVAYLRNALEDKEKLAVNIRLSVADILPAIHEDCWEISVIDLIKYTTLWQEAGRNGSMRFDGMIENCEHSVVDEYTTFFVETMDNTTRIDCDTGVFRCRLIDMPNAFEKHYRLEFDLNEDDDE